MSLKFTFKTLTESQAFREMFWLGRSLWHCFQIRFKSKTYWSNL